jgi:hypothetical protein
VPTLQSAPVFTPPVRVVFALQPNAPSKCVPFPTASAITTTETQLRSKGATPQLSALLAALIVRDAWLHSP